MFVDWRLDGNASLSRHVIGSDKTRILARIEVFLDIKGSPCHRGETDGCKGKERVRFIDFMHRMMHRSPLESQRKSAQAGCNTILQIRDAHVGQARHFTTYTARHLR